MRRCAAVLPRQAGLVDGDILTTIDGAPLDSATALTQILDRHYPGDVIDLTWVDAAGSSAPARRRWAPDRNRQFCGRKPPLQPHRLPYAERVPNTTPYRVVQWTTGNVGKSSVEAITKNPTYELVGCYAWSKDKAGVDVGELVGIEPLGVKATNDVDALLALKPDCVIYNPMWINVDELVKILSAGVNVVTSASFITGGNLGDGRDRIEDACRQGGATMFGSGVSPGFADLLAIVAATACDRVDKVIIAETADTTLYDSPDTERPAGFGAAIDDPDLRADGREGHGGFRRSGASGRRRIRRRTRRDWCVRPSTPRPPRTWRWRRGPSRPATWQASSPAGRVGSAAGPSSTSTCGGARARRWSPTGRSMPTAGRSPSKGCRRSTMQVGFLPPQDFIENAKTIEDFFVLGHIMTAMPPIHAIPAVVAAAPGIATYNDLPLPQARGVVPANG